MPDTGFTAVVCHSRACGSGDPATVASGLFAALRAAVRESRHGVLVQACDAERRPVASAVRVGPLRTAADVDVLTAWLRAGDLDPGLLPAHLLDVHRRAATAPLN